MTAISNSTSSCMQSFSQLTATLVTGEQEYRELMPPEKIETEHGRFKIWSGNLGALKSGRGSLEFRLRESTVMQSNVVKLLIKLDLILQKSIQVTSGARLPLEKALKPEDLSELSSEDESESEDEDQFVGSELSMHMLTIIDILADLYKLSFKIRNAATRTNTLKSTLFKEIDEETKIDKFEQYAHYDHSHVLESFTYLRKHLMEQMTRILPESSEEAQEGMYLVQRLATTITRRRRALQYWQRHTKKLAVEPDAPEGEAVSPWPRTSSVPVKVMADQIPVQVTQRIQPAVHLTVPRSILSGTDATTYDRTLDNSFETESVISSVSTAFSVHGSAVDLPPPPVAALRKSEFLCPYCGIVCPSRQGKKRAWKSHVLQDLQPYICTYPDCSDAFQMYSSRRRWIEHERLVHRRIWQCFDHADAQFASSAELQAHLRSQHCEDVTETQIESLLDICDSSIADTRKRCPICLVKAPFQKGIDNHLAFHLETFATFSIPRSIFSGEESESEAGSTSGRLGGPRSDMSTESISLSFQSLDDLRILSLETDSRITALCEKLDKSERRTILNWISDIPHEDNHFFARQGRTIGTGEWLLRDERYREWRASSTSKILWLHGVPGCGKTKLVSTVIDDLLQKVPEDEALAYFYCDRDQPDHREPASVLRSFLRQLSVPRNNDAIPGLTVQMYNQKRHNAFISGKLKLRESQAVLTNLFETYSRTTLVVDALDECDRKTRLDFMKIVKKSIAESSKPVVILISSRQDGDIKRLFEDGPSLEIRAIDNRDDIARFVNHEVTASKSFWRDQISPELKELICNTLVDGSEGMFRWVALQIAQLRELSCGDIRNRLGKLPKTLKTTYDELYLKIQSQPESAPIIANRAFQWVMCSCWPLSAAELVAAVCQDPDTDEIDEVDININSILGVCQNLLVVDQELNFCRFSHLSVKEYFQTYHWSSCEADSLVGKVCLSLLINDTATPNNRAHDALEYALLHWIAHVQRLEENGIVENRLTTLLKRFIGSMDQSSLSYRNWHEMVGKYFGEFKSGLYRRTDVLPLHRVYKWLSPCSQASLAVVTFGFHNVILDWWTVGFASINQTNSSGESLLQLGALRGFLSITKDLLKMGADVNAIGGQYGTALQAASSSGQESTVQLLLEQGAEANVIGGQYGTALQAASSSGHESIVQLLLEQGADTNVMSEQYGTALQAASSSGHESIVQLLLEQGADANVMGGQYGTALQAASSSGHESIVQLLLEQGADVNAIGGEYGSALKAASIGGHEAVLQLLRAAANP